MQTIFQAIHVRKSAAINVGIKNQLTINLTSTDLTDIISNFRVPAMVEDKAGGLKINMKILKNEMDENNHGRVKQEREIKSRADERAAFTFCL